MVQSNALDCRHRWVYCLLCHHGDHFAEKIIDQSVPTKLFLNTFETDTGKTLTKPKKKKQSVTFLVVLRGKYLYM